MSGREGSQGKDSAHAELGSGVEAGNGSPDSSLEQSPESRESTGKQSEEDLIPVPPPTPKNGVSILAHKIWIGNLDKRLTE